MSAVASAKDLYHCKMQKLFEDEKKPFLAADELKEEHLKAKGEALQHFQDLPKFGGEELSEPYIALLKEVLILMAGKITS